jgi:predicted permease
MPEFLNSFGAVAEKVILLFIIIALGFICQKTKVLTDEGNRCMTNIVMYFITPCVIINAFSSTRYAKEDLLEVLKNIGTVALISIVLHIFMILAANIVFRQKNEDKRRVYRFGMVFSNAGFISLPLAQALIDTDSNHEGSLYAAIFLAVFNIVLWTWGYSQMSGIKEKMNWKKIVFNPGIIGVVIGLILFTSPLYVNFGNQEGIVLPNVVKEALSALSALNLPLPMIMVGYYLGKANLLDAFRDLASYICIIIRLLIIPLLTLGSLILFGIRGNVLVVSVLGAAAPIGATTTIFSAKFNRDTELSVRLVSLSTICSMLTMPLIVGLTQYLS